MTASTAPTPAGETTLPPPGPPRFHSGKTFFWGVVLILLVGFLAWYAIGYIGIGGFQDTDQKRVTQRQEILQKRNADDAKLLNDPPSYLDKEKGTIRVPIDEAMKLTLPSLQGNKPHPAYPLTQDPPQPAAMGGTPAPAAAPAAGASPSPATTSAAVTKTAPTASVAPLPASAPAAAPSPVAPAAPSAPPQPAAAGTASPAPDATNNALNPGNPPPNGAQPQPAPSPAGTTETGAGSPTPTGAQPQPLTNPAPAPTPSLAPVSSPSPDPKEPGATPGSTP